MGSPLLVNNGLNVNMQTKICGEDITDDSLKTKAAYVEPMGTPDTSVVIPFGSVTTGTPAYDNVNGWDVKGRTTFTYYVVNSTDQIITVGIEGQIPGLGFGYNTYSASTDVSAGSATAITFQGVPTKARCRILAKATNPTSGSVKTYIIAR